MTGENVFYTQLEQISATFGRQPQPQPQPQPISTFTFTFVV